MNVDDISRKLIIAAEKMNKNVAYFSRLTLMSLGFDKVTAY